MSLLPATAVGSTVVRGGREGRMVEPIVEDIAFQGDVLMFFIAITKHKDGEENDMRDYEKRTNQATPTKTNKLLTQ